MVAERCQGYRKRLGIGQAVQRCDQGVEIVAAADYDQYLEQGKENTSAKAVKPAFMDDTAQAPAPGDASRVLKNIAFGRESEVERKAAGKKVSQALFCTCWLATYCGLKSTGTNHGRNIAAMG